MRKEAVDYILSNKYSERSEEYLYREIKEKGKWLLVTDLDDLAYDRMLDDATEAYWADTNEVQRIKFEDYGVPDEFYAEHLTDWYTYCDEASDDSFPIISEGVRWKV
jgi:hypothetical protein